MDVHAWVDEITPMRKHFSFALFILITCQPFSVIAEKKVVGRALGSPVYRAQLVATDPYDIHAELQDLFTIPVLERYLLNNSESLNPTQEEIERFTAFYDKQHYDELKDKKRQLEKKIIKISKLLHRPTIPEKEKDDLIAELYFLKSELEPPGHNYAMFVLPQWKLHVHLYKKYGGGRILWQQSGYEAFDAMHAWLKLQENNGAILFLDKSVRSKFYHYWTEFDHGPYLINDQAVIVKEFLQPEWLSQESTTTKTTPQ